MSEATQTQQQQQSIPDLLKAFGKRPGCEPYAGDSAKVDLLTLYLWVRQLTPDLSFELFLDRFAPLADFDDINRKYPGDAIRRLCPRNRKHAEEWGAPQWSAAQVVDFIGYYVDMIRAAEQTNVAVPCTLNLFLEKLGQKYLDCGFGTPAPAAPVPAVAPATGDNSVIPEGVMPEGVAPAAPKPKQPKPRRVTKADAPADADWNRRPDREGQAVVYTLPNNRQFRATVLAVHHEGDQTHMDIQTESGERIDGCALVRLTLLPPEQVPEDPTNPVLCRQTEAWPPAQLPAIVQALASKQPDATRPLGEAFFQQQYRMTEKYGAVISVCNGEAGAFVDAVLYDTTNQTEVCELPPREESILGVYRFVTPDGDCVLEIVGRV